MYDWLIFIFEHYLWFLTFIVFVAVIQIIDFNGKNIARNLSMEMRLNVMMFPVILALLNHICNKQVTSLTESAPR